jgi:hypothetical protein
MKNILLEFSTETMTNPMILKQKSEAPGDIVKAACHSISG